MKTLLFEWKFKAERSLSFVFAKMCDIALKTHFEKDIVLIPIPPRPGKIRKVGWDQIAELSHILKALYDYKVLHLLKRKTKIQQKKLNRELRLNSGSKSYVASNLLKSLAVKNQLPKHVILLDDVLTTGITVENCAKILKSFGIPKVDVLTLVIVD